MRFGVVLLFLALLVGCNSKNPTVDKKESAAQSAGKVETYDGYHTGKILTVLKSGDYDFIQVADNGGDSWVMARSQGLKAGDVVQFADVTATENYVSQSLNKTFEKLYMIPALSKYLEGKVTKKDRIDDRYYLTVETGGKAVTVTANSWDGSNGAYDVNDVVSLFYNEDLEAADRNSKGADNSAIYRGFNIRNKAKASTTGAAAKKDPGGAVGRIKGLVDQHKYEEAFSAVKPLADSGNQEAIYQLAEMYDRGWGTPTNKEEAFFLYRKAADLGHPDAQASVGYAYMWGDGIKKNYATALEWFNKAVANGSTLGTCGLGELYEEGFGVKRDYQEALRRYQDAAAKGNPRGILLVGWMYEKGKGVKKDPLEALDRYRQSAEKGYRTAQFRAGYLYEEGLGVKKDRAEAAKWYQKAADQNFSDAQYNLGLMYLYGKGVSRNGEKAKKLFKAAAANGDKDAGKLLRDEDFDF